MNPVFWYGVAILPVGIALGISARWPWAWRLVPKGVWGWGAMLVGIAVLLYLAASH